ncbi:MAG: hypothetical protein P1U90_20195 [Akkermansiaceae bacterium]|nr:hypothetical protein [Akkermansiaceae bacterium]
MKGRLGSIVLLVCLSMVMAPQVFGQKRHVLGESVEFQMDERWKLHYDMNQFRDGLLHGIAIFTAGEGQAQEAIFYSSLEGPLVMKSKGIFERVSEAVSAPMVKRLEKNGVKVGKVLLTESKALGENYRLFQRGAKEKGVSVGTMCGIVWKTERRFYSLMVMKSGKAIPLTFWVDLLKGWKELEEVEALYQESYQSRKKFLTEAQMKKLPPILKGEMAAKLVWTFAMAEAKEIPVAKEREKEITRLNREKGHAEARMMRVIYHELFTPDQQTKFRASIARRSSKTKR